MSTLAGMWRSLWRGTKPPDDWDDVPETAGGRWSRAVLRLAVIFGLLFGCVFFAFWWAGAAVNFTAARAADRSAPTWIVEGLVRDAVSHQPIPWAKVEDDPAGQPPFFHVDADIRGVYLLSTLAEPHHVRVSAPGYTPQIIPIGRAWFVWMPRGKERKEINLVPLRH
ncbi:MAG: carboxypeptidase-like regulatory domain-containing protein [Candidatus Solibacter sp.]